MDWFIAGLIVLLGAGLALGRSSWCLDYAIVVFVFNRGLRRYIDWCAGAFNPFSPISLTPLFVASLMLIPFLARLGRLSPRIRKIFFWLGLALGYAFVIGFVRVRVASIYALAEFVAPVAMFGFAVTSRAPTNVRDRWIRTMSWCAVLASIYGWYQYLTIPPWDAFWVRAVGFEGYLGTLERTKMSVFSTMNERGVLAGYLGLSSVAMIVSDRWRTWLSWPGVILVLSCILLTMSRGGVIFAIIGVLSFVFINRGASLGRILLAMSIVGIAIQFGFERLPGSEAIAERFRSLKAMQSDGSFQGRVGIARDTLPTVLANPLGLGVGAIGLAGRINSGSGEDQTVIGDAGYSEIFLTFGWLGAAALFRAIFLIWQEMQIRYKAGARTEGLLLGRALMLGLIPMSLVGNLLSGISLFWLSFGYALSPLPKIRRLRIDSQGVVEGDEPPSMPDSPTA